MGKLFSLCKKNGDNQNQFCPDEKEINFKSYQSKNDKYFESIEKKYNVLTYIKLIDFMNLLSDFSIEKSTVRSESSRTLFNYDSTFLNETLHSEEFQSFLENQILKVVSFENDEELTSIFKDVFINIFKALIDKLSQHLNKDIEGAITKRNLIPLGLIFCHSSNIDKIKLFFDIFSNEEKQFISSNELNDFLVCLFLIPSYCILKARKVVGSTHEKIGALNTSEITEIVETCELKDIENLMKLINEKLFNNKSGYEWEEFKMLFENENSGLGWIFSSQGIRKKLEENNL